MENKIVEEFRSKTAWVFHKLDGQSAEDMGKCEVGKKFSEISDKSGSSLSGMKKRISHSFLRTSER